MLSNVAAVVPLAFKGCGLYIDCLEQITMSFLLLLVKPAAQDLPIAVGGGPYNTRPGS